MDTTSSPTLPPPPAEPPADGGREGVRRPRKGRRSHRLGTVLVVLGVFVLLYAGVILIFGDPATRLYHDWEQRGLSNELDKSFDRFATKEEAAAPATMSAAEARRRALAFIKTVDTGDAVGRIDIRRIGKNEVVVNGTRWWEDLSRGPGRYTTHGASWPGLGGVTGVAAHRTTFGAAFRHIDDIKKGDRVLMRMPYATFTYVVTHHKVVSNNDWSIIRPVGYEELVLSACEPLYSASHRYVVFAKLAAIAPPER